MALNLAGFQFVRVSDRTDGKRVSGHAKKIGNIHKIARAVYAIFTE
jgi:riboflavin synthase alpha subunit